MRVWELALEDISDAVNAEIDALLPTLVEAGFVSEEPWGEDSGWFLWRFTSEGVARVELLERVA